jgi:hypothetical protein
LLPAQATPTAGHFYHAHTQTIRIDTPFVVFARYRSRAVAARSRNRQAIGRALDDERTCTR